MEQSHISFDLVGSKLGEDLLSDQGILLLKKGVILQEVHILLLHKYRFGTKIKVDMNGIETSTKLKEPPSAKPYKSFQSYIKDTFQTFLSNKSIDLSDVREKYHELVELSLSDFSIMRILQAKVSKEGYLYQHSVNVGILSAIIGRLLGYNREGCLLLADMGLWHDIGMFTIDKGILEKRGPLLSQEFQQIQMHSLRGFYLLKSIPNINPVIPLSSLSHHERINGSGYPNQLKDSSIPYSIQIISVADCFNAMSMKVNYGEKKSLFKGVYELVNEISLNKLNPAIVIPFVRYIMRQNLHQRVMLSTEEEAEIVFIHDNEPHQPLVKVKDQFIDLRKEPSIKIVNLMEKIEQETIYV
jgi:HD-GYP domain-containing protein (c-di-GMP phosphodiesterase class II)